MKMEKEALKEQPTNVIEKGDVILLTFLQRTKDGHFTPLEKKPISFARVNEETEVIESYEEGFYYSIV